MGAPLADSVAVGYRKDLVSARWPILLFPCTNGHRKWSFHLVGTQFQAAFSLEERSLDGEP